jgi:hypothetical protein
LDRQHQRVDLGANDAIGLFCRRRDDDPIGRTSMEIAVLLAPFHLYRQRDGQA